MKKYQIFLLAALTLLAAACSSGKKMSGVWVNKEKAEGKIFKSIFIIALTGNKEARIQVEDDLAAAVVGRGFKAVKSMDVMPPKPGDTSMIPKEEMVAKIKASGCDGVMVASLLKKDENVNYVPAETGYQYQPFYTRYGGNYYGYYSNWYPSVSNDEYYKVDQTYFVQTAFYDVATEEIMFTVKSEVFNPTTIKRFSRNYTSSLMEQLEQAKVLKKQK